jgi:GNAT superfamily N-acetyltransferase
MKSSSGYEIYHNTLSSCLDEIERYVESKGYTLGDYFPEVNHVSYGTTARTSVEMLKNGNISNSLAVQIYRMDSGKYELNCYPVRKFAKGGKVLFYTDEKPYGVLRGTIEGEIAKLGSIEIKPRFKGMGYGTSMVSDFENWSKENGAKEIEIDAYKKSLKFWENVGYKIEPEFQVIGGYKQDYKTGTKQLYSKGGYTRPAIDMPISGVYKFSSKIGDFTLKVYNFERNDDTTDALEIQDELRPKLGTIIIKNSAWKRLSKGLPIKAKTYRGNYNGTLIRLGSTKDVEFATGGGLKKAKSSKEIKILKYRAKMQDYWNNEIDAGDRYEFLVSAGYDDSEANDLKFEDWEDLKKSVQNSLIKEFYNIKFETGGTLDLFEDEEKYGQGGGLKLLKVGDKYLYKFDGTKYKILGIKDKQVAIVPLVGHKRNWIVSKAVLQKWVQSGMMQKIK